MSARIHTLAALAIAGALVQSPAFAGDPAKLEMGKKLFTQGAVPACAICHTLKDAESAGAVGPDLDELAPDAARVAKALRDGIGSMPSYKATLTDEQIEALAAYVAKSTGAAAK